VPDSAVRNFADPDEYAVAIRATRVELSRMSRGNFAAGLVKLNLGRLWMQRCSETLPRLAHLDNVRGRAIFCFAKQSTKGFLINGREVPPTALLRFSEGFSCFQRSTGPAELGTMSLPVPDIEDLGATFGGTDFTPPHESVIVHPSPAAMEKLQRLHAAAGHLAKDAPEIVDNPEAARGLEQALIAALADCLSGADQPTGKVRWSSHEKIMRGFHRILESDRDHVFHVPEMCRLLAVSNRTLTTCCNDALGMPPHRYLRLRQLNLAHRALKLADPAKTSVTEIATGFGFWELGRFAAAYRALFDEPPSATLMRPAGAGSALPGGRTGQMPSEFA
jgi:AraC-like DNA-binding protein